MKKSKVKKINKPIRSTDVPATAKMLSDMEDRLNHRITSEIHGVKAEIHGLKSDVHGMKSELHRVAVLVEEQNARNRYVMDGYTQLYDLINARFGGGEQQV